MAKKRQQSRQDASRDAKRRVGDKNAEPSGASAAAGDAFGHNEREPTVEELYELCFRAGDRHEQRQNVRKWTDRGSLETTVWPFLKNADRRDEAEILQASLLVAQFVAHRCWEGSFAGNSMLAVLDDHRAVVVLFDSLLYKSDAEDFTLRETVVHFVVAVLQSDNRLLHECLAPHVSGIGIWHHMPNRRLRLETKKSPGMRRKLQQTSKRDIWIVSVVNTLMHFFRTATGASSVGADDAKDTEGDRSVVPRPLFLFVHRALELVISLLTMHSSRKYLLPYLDSIHFSVRARNALASMEKSENVRLAQQLLSQANQLIDFPIQEYGKTHLSKFQVVSKQHARAIILQKLAHRHYPHALQQIVFAGVGLLCAPDTKESFLQRSLAALSEEQFEDLLRRMCLLEKGDRAATKDYMYDVLSNYLAVPSYPIDQLRAFPLYPTEAILWDHNVIPPSNKALRLHSVLSVPKLNRQFLSYQDYLLRNFELVRLESAYEIRSDVVQVLQRLHPVLKEDHSSDPDQTRLRTEFNGWSRMAAEIHTPLKIIDVQPPKIGETVTSRVTAVFEVDLKPFGDRIQREWDELMEFDNVFLINIDASKMNGQSQPTLNDFYAEHGINKPSRNKYGDKKVPADEDSTFPARMGVRTIRGCMILEIKDEDGSILSDPSERKNDSRPKGTKRVFKVAMDVAQYDIDRRSPGGIDIYNGFNIVMRRHGRENNFKSMLECIRGLLEGSGSIDRVLPEWLHRLFLGQDDPTAAHYSSDSMKKYAEKTVGVSKPTDFMDFRDTFLDVGHLENSFKEKVHVEMPAELAKSRDESAYFKVRVSSEDESQLEAVSVPVGANMNVKGNSVRYTPAQVEAIRSGLSPGLTVCVGPPGTGKTDVAVQIIACLFHTYPTQRTVIVTHSNAALNDIFDKVMARGDIDEKHLLRLGSGEKDLQTESTHDFTKIGRVNFTLQRRAALLERVQQLSESLGVSSKEERSANGESAYTCESADYFRKQHIDRRIEKLEAILDGMKADDDVLPSDFPFTAFFSLAGTAITKSKALELVAEVTAIFNELQEYRAYELLRSQRQRSNFLILKQARIVAMTCTHASIVRSQLVELGFEYDNIIMEESAQMTEIEAFIPLLLQKGEADEGVAGKSRLKRVCMLGDHHQLPPVVKNSCLAKFSNLDQSLFTRLIRNGVPYIQLDKQGRARPSLASLYNWRYKELGDLDHVTKREAYQLANTGLVHTCQIIDVGDFNGKGESTPTPYFYQNVGEAEYVVALFQYMVLVGYPAKKISIITTYNGQKDLITDVLSQRYGPGTPFAGIRPRAISTVDQYQGQQNDYILLSLVRTSSVGHLRDIRRLVVAVSRSRLGMYVFCRSELFAGCHELRNTFDQLMSKPTKLQLVVGESYPTERRADDEIAADRVFDVDDVRHMGSIVHSMQEKWIGSNGS